MKIANQLVPEGTKIYKTLERCCRYQFVRPAHVQSVQDKPGEPGGPSYVGFAALPEKINGVYIAWHI